MPRGGPETNDGGNAAVLPMAHLHPSAAEGRNPTQGLFGLDVTTLVSFHYWMQSGLEDSSKNGDVSILQGS